MENVNMSEEELAIAKKLIETDPEFNDLWQEHLELKRKLKELETKGHLTLEDENEIKKIKRLKLMGKDKIATKIHDYKVGVLSPD